MKWVLAVALAAATAIAARAQFADSFVASRDVPAIAYSTAPVSNRVTALNDRLRDGSVRLSFDQRNGYLRSVLDALRVPVES